MALATVLASDVCEMQTILTARPSTSTRSNSSSSQRYASRLTGVHEHGLTLCTQDNHDEKLAHRHSIHSSNKHHIEGAYAARYGTSSIPKYKLPRQGIDARATYQLIHDELTLDGSPNLNLASFVHTWMPDEANKLMMENISKNLIDQDEYPMTRASRPHISLALCSSSRVVSRGDPHPVHLYPR